MPWFRVDADVGAHPKVALLAERLGLSRREALGVLVLLWGWASTYCRSGRVPERYIASLALALEVASSESERVIEVLVDVGVLDRDRRGLVVHGFMERNGRQLREIERKRKARERARTVRG